MPNPEMDKDEDIGLQTFVARQTYRRRRLMDAARALPVLGLMLWMLPLLWQLPADSTTRASSALIYIFVVWALLAGLATLVVIALKRSETKLDAELSQSGHYPDERDGN